MPSKLNSGRKYFTIFITASRALFMYYLLKGFYFIHLISKYKFFFSSDIHRMCECVRAVSTFFCVLPTWSVCMCWSRISLSTILCLLRTCVCVCMCVNMTHAWRVALIYLYKMYIMRRIIYLLAQLDFINIILYYYEQHIHLVKH